jgi:hypothetical protein
MSPSFKTPGRIGLRNISSFTKVIVILEGFGLSTLQQTIEGPEPESGTRGNLHFGRYLDLEGVTVNVRMRGKALS